jgi:hypothetical protein
MPKGIQFNADSDRLSCLYLWMAGWQMPCIGVGLGDPFKEVPCCVRQQKVLAWTSHSVRYGLSQAHKSEFTLPAHERAIADIIFLGDVSALCLKSMLLMDRSVCRQTLSR